MERFANLSLEDTVAIINENLFPLDLNVSKSLPTVSLNVKTSTEISENKY